MAKTLQFEAFVDREDVRAPRYVVVPRAVIAPWGLGGAAVVDGTIEGSSLGRHFLIRWDDAHWFLELSDDWCARAGIATAQRVEVRLWLTSTALPHELARRIAEAPSARSAWEALTPRQQRELGELVVPARRRRRTGDDASYLPGLVDETLFDDYNSWATLAQLDDSE